MDSEILLDELASRLSQREAELALISSVQTGLLAKLEMREIYEMVGNRLRDLFEAQVTGIYTFDHDSSLEHFQYLYEDGERLYPESRPLNQIRKWIIANRTILLINENADESVEKITGDKHLPVPGTRLPKSLVFVPLIVDERVTGCLSLQSLDRENAFSESDVQLLSTLANSISIALENARLFNESEQRNAELAVINSVQEGLVREMDMLAIYKLVGNRLCDVLKTQTLIIRTFGGENEMETWEYAIEKDERIYVEPRPLMWANEHLLKTKAPLIINREYVQTAQKYGGTGVTKGLPPKSAIFVPMMVGDKVIGSISLQNVERENAFNDSDIRLLTTLTNSMSVALENARLFNETTRLLAETEHLASELQTVNNISKAMVSQLDLGALIQLVGDQMRDTFKADIVYIALYDKETDMIHFPYEYGDKNESRRFGNGFTERIISSNTPLLINKGIDEIRQQLKSKRIGRVTSSFLGVPIQTGDCPNGVISVQSTVGENRFNEDDLRLLTTIAANVSVALQNAEAYSQLQSALNDLQAAQEQLVQQEKLASLGQLTAGIAHEIKNPLNFVNNFSNVSLEMIDEVLEELQKEERRKKKEEGGLDVAPDPALDLVLVSDILTDIRQNLTKIHEHGSRADGIVKSMLQHSRGGSGKMEPTNLNALISEFTNLSYHGMRASKDSVEVQITLDLDDAVGDVPVVFEDFSRVIVNICSNAFDAMRGSGGGKARLAVRTRRKGNRVTVEIEDNGPGIPDDIKDKILQPFFTTKKGTQGTGLGLSITHDIVKAHGGDIQVVSEVGKGTTFIISLAT
jgi:signal transduction histidine kinase